MTERPPQTSGTGARADAAGRAAATAITVEPGERLRLAEGAEPATFTFDRGRETLGRVRMWSDGEIRLTLGDREFRLRPDGRGRGLTLSTAAKDAPVLARFEDRRFRGDLIHLADRALTFTGEDEHLCDHAGQKLVSFTPRAPDPRTRIVLVDPHATVGAGEDEAAVLAFAAVIVLLRRLPAQPSKRFGMGGGQAAPGTGVWIAGAMSGHADGSF